MNIGWAIGGAIHIESPVLFASAWAIVIAISSAVVSFENSMYMLAMPLLWLVHKKNFQVFLFAFCLIGFPISSAYLPRGCRS